MSKVDGDEVLIKARVPEGTPEEDIEIYLTDNYGAPTYKLPWELITTPQEAEPILEGEWRLPPGIDEGTRMRPPTERTNGHIDQPVGCDLKNKGNGELYEIGIRLQGELSAAKNKIFRLESTQRQQFDIARTLQSRINELQKQISSTHDERREELEPSTWVGGSFSCPICGKEYPHEHSGTEIAEHRILSEKPVYMPQWSPCVNCGQHLNVHVRDHGTKIIYCPQSPASGEQS